ncbi:hypothetical protein ACRALDRAFT_208957 [Sodiomyces alcalophilus JCM 7366]|uniref:uncharacterized protein n=1 Tax=Sodiomyces alcalophilus JCM 7366 TaxID=591952 RepID=UPI0039B3FA7D
MTNPTRSDEAWGIYHTTYTKTKPSTVRLLTSRLILPKTYSVIWIIFEPQEIIFLRVLPFIMPQQGIAEIWQKGTDIAIPSKVQFPNFKPCQLLGSITTLAWLVSSTAPATLPCNSCNWAHGGHFVRYNVHFRNSIAPLCRNCCETIGPLHLVHVQSVTFSEFGNHCAWGYVPSYSPYSYFLPLRLTKSGYQLGRTHETSLAPETVKGLVRWHSVLRFDLTLGSSDERELVGIRTHAMRRAVTSWKQSLGATDIKGGNCQSIGINNQELPVDLTSPYRTLRYTTSPPIPECGHEWDECWYPLLLEAFVTSKVGMYRYDLPILDVLVGSGDGPTALSGECHTRADGAEGLLHIRTSAVKNSALCAVKRPKGFFVRSQQSALQD